MNENHDPKTGEFSSGGGSMLDKLVAKNKNDVIINKVIVEKQAGDWLQKWTWGTKDTGNGFKGDTPPENVVKYFSDSRPKEPIIVYRAHYLGADSKPYESWTTNKEMASGIAEMNNDDKPGSNIVLTRRVDPSEIVVEVNKLPKQMREANGLDDEVIIANGDAAKTIANIRGEKSVKGQQWSGKSDSIIRDYNKYKS